MTKGVIGIIGDGSIAELRAMADRMPYRGQAHVWSPAPRVLLGELSSSAVPQDAHCPTVLALDSNGWLYEGADRPCDLQERAAAERMRLASALERSGPGALADLSGFFALAYWDDRARTLMLACDRQGYKGLYFAQLEGRIAFASDLKALLALPDCPASVNRNVLQTYLSSHSFNSGCTLLDAARPVGQAMTVTIGLDLKIERAPYWQPTRGGPGPSTFADAARTLRSILERVLLRQLRGHTRAGLLLSGGLDSASLLALVKHVRPDLEINAYTIGHSEQDLDVARARATAAHFRTAHREYLYDLARLPADLERLVWLTEDLTGREESLLQQSVTAHAAEHERVVLAGHGADAALAGMPRHRLLWLRDRMPWPVSEALCDLFNYTQTAREPRSWLGRRLVGWEFGSDRPQMPQVLGAAEIPRTHCRSLAEYRRSAINSQHGLRYHEPMDAACDLTMPAPFLDPEVTQFALDCSTGFLIDARRQKRVLRAALHDLAPPAIRGLPKTLQRLKHDAQFSAALDDLARQLKLFATLDSRAILAPDYLSALQKRGASSAYSSDRIHILWTLICTELWMRQFIDARGAPSASKVLPPCATG